MTTVYSDDARLKKIRKKMTAATQEVAEDFADKAEKLIRGVSLIYFDIGKVLFTVIVEEAEYGSNAVEHLAEFLGVNPKFLYGLRDFAQTYQRDFIERCALRTMADGGRIEFEHLKMLMVVKSEKERLEILEKVFAESLSLRELARIVSSPVSGRVRVVTQRKLPKPTSPIMAAAQLHGAVKRINEHFAIWSDSLVKGLAKADPTDDTTVLLQRLRNARAEVYSLVDRFGVSLKAAIEKLECASNRQSNDPHH